MRLVTRVCVCVGVCVCVCVLSDSRHRAGRAVCAGGAGHWRGVDCAVCAGAAGKLYAWMDEWYGLTEEQIREWEQKVAPVYSRLI